MTIARVTQFSLCGTRCLQFTWEFSSLTLAGMCCLINIIYHTGAVTMMNTGLLGCLSVPQHNNSTFVRVNLLSLSS